VFDPAHPGSLSNPDTSSGFATGDAGNTVALTVDASGNLYYLSGTSGQVERISYSTPVITPAGQPTQPGQSATFVVTAAGGAPLSFQWQHLVKGAWTNVGTNSATFTVASARSADAGSYRVIVSNSLGQATSITATLSVGAGEKRLVSISAPELDGVLGR